MPRTRCEYRFSMRYGREDHMWTCIGALGGLHLHISGPFDGRYSGGLEEHRRTPPDRREMEPPDHDECWLLKCPCWHDGTSLYVSEVAIPLWLEDKNDHLGMFAWLGREYDKRFLEERE